MHDEVKNRVHEMHSTQRGYILLPVVLFITVIATIAFLINNDSAINVDKMASQAEAQQADAVAQAGLAHAVWGAQNSGCAGDIAMTSVPFGQTGAGSYTATVTTAGGTTTAYPNLAADQDSWFRSDDITNNNGGTTSTLHLRMETGMLEYAVVRFDLSSLPAGAQINSATARFYVKATKGHPEGPVNIHRVTADWTETGATWETMATSFDSATLNTIPAQPLAGDNWVQVNLTAQVQAWVNGGEPNYGIMLIPTGEGTHAEYISREGAANQQPQLNIVVGTGPASPANIQVTGTLTGNPSPDNDITRILSRTDVTAYQPANFLQLQPDAAAGMDAWVTSTKSNWNYGGHGSLNVNSGGQRSLLAFNLAGLPYGAKVVSASLELFNTANSTAAVTVHRLTTPWTEGSCSGAGCTADGVTWDTTDSSTPWSTGGGDFDTSPAATRDVAAISWSSWDLSNLVAGWLSGSYTNYGLLLTTSSGSAQFTSSDSPTVSQHPKLSITYSCECGITCLTPQGSGKIALIGDDNSPDPDDQLKIEIFESWGYEVDFYQDLDSASINWSNYDLAYVSETVISGDVNANLSNLSIGVVNEEPKLYDDLQLANGDTEHVGSSIDITDNSHYISSIFPQGALSIYDADMEILTADTPLAGGLQTLGEYSGAASLTALNQGAPTTSGTAAGRRVTLPLGQHFASGFNWSQLNNNGRLMVQRAIQWGAGASVAAPQTILFVVPDATALGPQDTVKKTLMESWGFNVALITAADSQANFDAAVASADVAYISEEVTSSDVGTKLRGATIGIVNEETALVDEFGIASTRNNDSETDTVIVDATHYITSVFGAGLITLTSSDTDLNQLTGTLAPGLNSLSETSGVSSLATIEAGGLLYDSGTAAGRRVQLPWGGNAFDINLLTADGRTLMQRAIEWGASVASLSGPIAHWKLDETSGTTAVDSEGGHDGTLMNGPVWTAGSIDGGLDFDGVNDYVDVGTFDVSGSGLTMMGWFNADTIPTSDPRIISKANGTNVADAWWQLSTTDSGSNRYLRMRIKAGGTTTTFADSSVNLATGQWYFVVATYDNASGAMKLYLDGTEVASGSHAVGGPVDTGPTVPVAIGANDTTARFFDGILDDVRVYDRALGATEISDLFTAGGGGGGPPPPGSCDGTYRDQFDARTWDGTNGSIDWTNPWLEVGESDGTTSGDIRVENDVSNYQLRIRDNNNGGEGAKRAVDLTGAGSASVNLQYRRQSLDSASDYVSIQASSTGVDGTFNEIGRIDGASVSTDGSYQTGNYALGAEYLIDQAAIRLISSSSMGGSDIIWFDDIEVVCSP